MEKEFISSGIIYQELLIVRKSIEDQGERLAELREEIAAIKARSSLWGAIGGGAVALIGLLIELLRR